jgi:hypothetical protein
MIYKMCIAAHGEESPRVKTFTMALPGTLNAMTDSDRAQRYRNEVGRILEYADDNPLLLIANQASELYYATGLLPFMGHTELDAFKEDAIGRRLEQQITIWNRLPLVVFIQRGHDSNDMEAFRQELLPWMRKHGYQLVYGDPDIELFKAIQVGK